MVNFLNNQNQLNCVTQFNCTSFLDSYQLQIVQVPSDGFCFYSCIRLFFKEFLGDELSLSDIKHMYQNFCENHPSQNYDQIDNINELVQEYFTSGNFDSNLVDLIINLSPQVSYKYLVVL